MTAYCNTLILKLFNFFVIIRKCSLATMCVMKNKLSNKWLHRLEILDIAFQPILHMHNGKIFAVEALLRNYEEAGFNSIFSVFDEAYEENILYAFDIRLREKAIKKFTTIAGHENLKLFYNLDNRLLLMPDFSDGNTSKILQSYNVPKDSICFEISERHEISKECNLEEIISHYKNDDFCIAIDDFGVGYSGYKLLYDSTPNVIKIDRFFLQDIQLHNKKKIMVKSIVNLAIQLGIKVVAEGVETEEEFLICKDMGCNFVQGYLIQKPTKKVEKLQKSYSNIVTLIEKNRRKKHQSNIIKNNTLTIKPLTLANSMNEVIDYFNTNKNIENIPILDHNNEPIGILQEKQIKSYIYSPYGRSLLLKKQNNKSKLKNLVTPCPYTDINNGISNIIELYSNTPDSVGVIVTKENEYYGFLSSRAIIEIMHDKNILFAREQNPLTKLPGNVIIEEYIDSAISGSGNYILCYFDLDNFKAFNDVYGFRNGDRVIQLFADIMRKKLPNDFLKAHIGGDDFFCAIKTDDSFNQNVKLEYIFNIIEKFTNDVKEFYSQDDKENGYISSKDRDGKQKNFELLTVSASILIIGEISKHKSINTVHSILSSQKKVAKQESKHASISSLL